MIRSFSPFSISRATLGIPLLMIGTLAAVSIVSAAEGRPQDGAAPSLGSPSLTLEGNLSLSDTGAVFKNGDPFLWDEDVNGNIALGRGSLVNNTSGTGNTAIGQDALREQSEYPIGSPFYFAGQNTAVGHSALKKNDWGAGNTAIGYLALSDAVDGPDGNTAVGSRALSEAEDTRTNTAVGASTMRRHAGDSNTALGAEALAATGDGDDNVAVGYFALQSTAAGYGNVAIGRDALSSNTLGNNNTAVGTDALVNNQEGSSNIAIGHEAGYNLGSGAALGGSDNILIGHQGVDGDNGMIRIGSAGTHTKAYLAGIAGNMISAAGAVSFDSNGQLGLAISSRRFKEAIQDIGNGSARLHHLRPVRFRHKGPDNQEVQFGLIAEEVAEVFPELVLLDDDGRPISVRYHLLDSLLLNELQRQEDELKLQRQQIAELRRIVEALQP